MRAVVDLAALGPRTLWIDCDCLQADGGTRTASITGGFVAMSLALLPLKIILVTLDLFVSTQMLVDVSRRLVNLMLT